MSSNEINVLMLQDKLKNDLDTAETKIQYLGASLQLMEHRLRWRKTRLTDKANYLEGVTAAMLWVLAGSGGGQVLGL